MKMFLPLLYIENLDRMAKVDKDLKVVQQEEFLKSIMLNL